MALEKRVQAWLEEEWARLRPFLPPSAPLLIAVSGGPDSLALLHVLQEIFPAEQLVAAHLHHGWREEADAEAEFVRQTAVSWGIACFIEEVDVVGLAREQALSLEEAGRKARYDFFARLATKIGAKAVAVGHHADDQAETVLMHLLRGSGLAGLRGMLPISPLPGAPDILLLRPLLAVSRAAIEAYCKTYDLQPVFDATNEDTTFFRNRLRHELLPLLAGYNPQIKARLQHMAAVVAADYAFLDELADEKYTAVLRESGSDWLALDRAGWLALPLSLRRAALRRAVWQLRADLRDVGFQPIEQARLVAEKDATGGQTTLPGGLVLTVEYERLTIAADPDVLLFDEPQIVEDTAVPLPVPGRVQLANGWVIESELVSGMDLAHIQSNPDPWTAYVDGGDEPLFVRGRQPGERLRPLGMSGQSAKLKVMMINRKIPARLREKWPIIDSASGLAWLVGHGIDERVKVTAVAQTIVRLHCRKT